MAIGACAVAMTACSSDDSALQQGQGKVLISATVNSDVTVVSRAQTEQELSDNCIVWISNDRGVVREYTGLSTIPADGIDLLSGHYLAEAWTGTKAWASFDDRWFEGAQEFDITKGETARVDLVCKITNTVVSVNYETDVDKVLSDYTLTVSHSKGSLTFEGRDERKGYFIMPDNDQVLECTIEGKLSNGDTYTTTRTIAGPKAATEYRLNVKYNPEADEQIGGAFFTITVDESAIEVTDQITIAIAPQIAGVGFNLSQGLMGESGQFENTSVYVTAAAALEDMIIETPLLETVAGLSGSDVDVLTMDEQLNEQLEAAGIRYNYVYNEAEDISNLKLTFTETFLNRLVDGDYTIGLTATDVNGKSTTAILNISVSAAPVITGNVNPVEVYATKAVLRGSKVKEADSYVFRYAALGSRAGWTEVPATIEGNELVAELTGLTPGTTYEYAAGTADFTGAVRSFTTEEAAQLPNAGFEEFNESNGYYSFYAVGGTKFWDSGNQGSWTMKKNVTMPDNTVKHSGNYSVKLESQFVGVGSLGAFAAGNIFIGDFLGTEGTNGVLGWGRAWSSRPQALKLYVKYTPANVTNVRKSGTPGIAKGDPDQGIVYIALLDNSVETVESWSAPVVIRTKTSKVFDPEGANVIAYGKLVFDGATPGDAMVEYTIPLNYVRTDVKPSNILLTASASINGDYFEGGPSVMYLDDLELIY